MKRWFYGARLALFRSPVKLIIYRVADPGWRVGWNRYHRGTPQQKTIGAGIVLNTRCVSFKWRNA